MKARKNLMDMAKKLGWLTLFCVSSSCGIRSISSENLPYAPSFSREAGLAQSQAPKIDVPTKANPQEINNPDLQSYYSSSPYYSSLPYYCDPYEYPPNIVSSISSCAPFYGNPNTAIDYRVKHHVGRRSGNNEDDDDEYRRKHRDRQN